MILGMIGYVEGKVVHKGLGAIVVSAGGVGYEISVTPDTISEIEPNSNVSIWTHLAVRENSLNLYGFPSREDLEFFELLLSVSGIGPKSALGIMALARTDTIKSSISKGDASGLSKVSGIGKKTAEKLVMELKEKIGAVADTSDSDRADSDAMEALTTMGYSVSEAREALKQAPKNITNSNELLREALKNLGK